MPKDFLFMTCEVSGARRQVVLTATKPVFLSTHVEKGLPNKPNDEKS